MHSILAQTGSNEASVRIKHEAHSGPNLHVIHTEWDEATASPTEQANEQASAPGHAA